MAVYVINTIDSTFLKSNKTTVKPIDSKRMELSVRIDRIFDVLHNQRIFPIMESNGIDAMNENGHGWMDR